jgi:hypothetical protein
MIAYRVAPESQLTAPLARKHQAQSKIAHDD